MLNLKKICLIAVAAMLTVGLSSCGWTKKKLGLTREGPDETKVMVNEPLILPPEYSVRPKNLEVNEEEEENW